MLTSLLLTTALSAAPTAFAFADESGKRLLAIGKLDEPARLDRASCDGTVVAAKFVAEQPAGPKDTGRLTSANFDQTAGAVFQLAGEKVARDTTCLLGTAEFFRAWTALAVKASKKRRCDEKAAAAAAALGARQVESCVEVGTFSAARLLLATFAKEGNQLLVGLVLLDGKRVAMRSFPAKLEPGAPSCWRVDDGCAFSPDSYRVPFVLKGQGELRLLGLWAGAEGQNVELLGVQGQALEATATASRYWAPQ